jgi:2,3-bisphosphoglycerate-independent phosphoglycerate mutase
MTLPNKRPVALIILDGWGISSDCANNAVCLARKPRLDSLFASCPSTTLKTSGLNVGLPEGQMGNSEVGHLNLGSGRIIYQELTRISKMVENGEFFENPVFIEALKKIRRAGGKLHLMGLLSDGGVHSHQTHLYALVELARRQGLQEVCIHAFMDGRDTPPHSGINFIAELENELARIGSGRLATVIGRYYAMDRDNRWDRVEQAWQAMVSAVGIPASSGAEAIQNAYDAGQSDEFVKPTIIAPYQGMNDGDGIIFFNFRADRAREITRCFTKPDFSGFKRTQQPALSAFVCMTEYDETFDLPIAFLPETYPDILGEVVSKAGLKQLRIAETEKYAHVTFFFNGGIEKPFPNEDRVLIPSPQDVATYDLKPEMSAPGVTDEVVRRIQSNVYDLIILNFANPDMVGHTGVLAAAIRAMETIDQCVGRVVDALVAAGGCALITADHGNCEQMADATGAPHTAHTTNIVPLILVNPPSEATTLRQGILADIAPTLLDLLGLPVPSAMTGRSLLRPVSGPSKS